MINYLGTTPEGIKRQNRTQRELVFSKQNRWVEHNFEALEDLRNTHYDPENGYSILAMLGEKKILCKSDLLGMAII
jgi:hypothetical protein